MHTNLKTAAQFHVAESREGTLKQWTDTTGRNLPLMLRQVGASGRRKRAVRARECFGRMFPFQVRPQRRCCVEAFAAVLTVARCYVVVLIHMFLKERMQCLHCRRSDF